MKNLHHSPKRKRAVLDSCDRSLSSTSSSPRSAASAVDMLSPVDINSGRESPQVIVTGQLRSLEIDGNTTMEDRAAEKGPQTDDQPQTPRRAGNPKRSSLPKSEVSNPNKSLKKGVKRRQSKSPTPGKDSPVKPRSARQAGNPPRSPPLLSQPEENPLTWHDSEITGYDPTDPDDDGYGLNGVGFKPSAAIAWDREEKRRRQIADWKAREGREERSKRRERRDGADTAIGPDAECRNRKRVRFESEIALDIT